MINESVEDYLKIIYELQREQGKVTTNLLAKHLEFAPASVTGMIKKLADLKLVTYEPYRGVILTEQGEKKALKIIRQHRLVELYLVKALGVPWDKVHHEAHKLEHVISDYIEDRMDDYLGHPTTDPHGHPIPAKNGTIIEPQKLPLVELQPKQTAKVAEISDQDPSFLRYLGGLGIYPRTLLSVVSVAPFKGPINVKIGNSEIALGREVCQKILVSDVK
jgi:DtxR family transcriptional regulator, Mn-dependent transcriptional regulator